MTATPTFPAATILGYPRIGPRRELKRAVESFWAGRTGVEELTATAADLRAGTRARLSGLGLGADDDQLSPHLRSRREVERVLGEAGVPVTVLRAGIVLGHEGLSWEMTRQLVEHLPAMITPRWVRTRTQPVAGADVVRYLAGVIGRPEALGRVFEIGGTEVLTYAEMMQRVARTHHHRTLPMVAVPLLTPGAGDPMISNEATPL